jgi:hypothetical protein
MHAGKAFLASMQPLRFFVRHPDIISRAYPFAYEAGIAGICGKKTFIALVHSFLPEVV